MTRTEEWTKTEDDYTTKAIVSVEEMVQVSSHIAEQLGLTPWQPRSWGWFPYEEVAAALVKDGRSLSGGLYNGRRKALHDAAGEIHKQELQVLAVLVEDPTSPRLNGAMSGLQHARQIVENMMKEN